MNEQLTLDLSFEINTLHDELTGLARTSLQKAIEIGRLLTEQKASLKHGEWLPWCKEHLRFSRQTADNYARLYRERDKLLTVGNLELTEAYRLLSRPAEEADVDADNTPDGPAISGDMEGSPDDVDLDGEWSYDPATEPDPESNCEPAALPEPRGNQEDTQEDKKHVHVAQNSGENEWYTPPQFIASARAVMGGIDTDPASSDIANKTVKAKRFFTKDDDGLQKKWKGSVWMNPPYAQPLIGRFAEAVCQKYEKGEISQAIVLVNNATETHWFQIMGSIAAAVCFPKSRIKFLDPSGNPGAPLQGQAILYFGDKPEAFSEEFKQYGNTFS